MPASRSLEGFNFLSIKNRLPSSRRTLLQFPALTLSSVAEPAQQTHYYAYERARKNRKVYAVVMIRAV